VQRRADNVKRTTGSDDLLREIPKEAPCRTVDHQDLGARDLAEWAAAECAYSAPKAPGKDFDGADRIHVQADGEGIAHGVANFDAVEKILGMSVTRAGDVDEI
jgi:hypothetical protein